MKILFRILTLFLTVPIAELFFLLQVEKLFDRWTGGYGLLLTMALIVATAVVGSYLAKREGLSTWNRLQNRLSGGGLPGDELLDAVIILVAGALLITPGVLTDLTGFIGLIPLTRGWVRRLAKKRLKKAMREGRIQTSFGTFGGATGPFGAEDSTTPPEEQAPTGEPDDPAVGGTPAERGPSPTQTRKPAPARPADQNRAPRNESPDRSADVPSSEAEEEAGSPSHR